MSSDTDTTKACGSSPFYFSEEIRIAISRIRGFCRKPALNSGGMLLVTGQRGVGKTRLVDEALNTRRDTAGRRKPAEYFSIATGHDPWRCRLIVERSPREVKRILLPVQVDPFFPESSNYSDRNEVDKDDAEPSAIDRDILALLRNLVFALTSIIDPRFSTRKFGRTLSARLGLWTFWFSATGLLKPQRLPKTVISILSLGLLVFFVAFLGTSWWTLGGLKNPSAWATPLLLSPLTFLCAAATAWLWLRYRDIRALQAMSSHLYDLVHAQEAGKTVRTQLEKTWRWESRMRNVLRLLALLVLAGGGVGLTDGLTLPAKASGTDATALGCCCCSQGPPSPAVPMVDRTTTALAPEATPIDKAWFLVLMLAGLVLFSASGSNSERLHASFGNGNRVWMITLLRRYLFMLHRVGLEPVLVVDEIDKLSCPANDDRSRSADKIRNTSAPADVDNAAADDDSPASTTKGERRIHCDNLIRFRDTLLRLKQSLGADFIWILIDSDQLYDLVVTDRNRHGGQGPLSTLIQVEVGLGPLSFSDFKRYAIDRINLTNKHAEKGQAQAPTPDAPTLARWWLESRGVFSGLVRQVGDYLDQKDFERDRERTPVLGANALFFADVLDYLRSDRLDNLAGFAENHPRRSEQFREQLADSPWHRMWVEIGLMEIAARMASPTLPTPRYRELLPEEQEAGDDLISNSPMALRRKGELALFNLLRQAYLRGFADGELKIPKGKGIPLIPKKENYDSEIQLELPDRWPPD